MNVKFVVLAFCLAATTAQAADTLGKVRAAGHLRCGVVAEAEDWNKDDLHGSLAALGHEICGAVAAAALGERPAVITTAYAVEADAEQGLAKGKVDLVVGVSPSATAALRNGIRFSAPVFYDAVGVLVRRASHIDTLQGLAGKKLCYEQDTDLDRLVQARLIDRGIKLLPFPFQEQGEMEDGLIGGHCDAIAGDLSKLAQTRASYPAAAKDLALLPDTLALDPVAAATAEGDARWAAIVDWTIYALIQAEASGVTRANVHGFKPGDDPVDDRLLGVDWAAGQALGLPKDWAVHALATTGNYGEIYARSLGAGSPYGLPRGFNALWLHGGLMAPMAIR